MIKVDLKGTVKEFEAGVSAAEVAKSIGMGLYKSACAAKVDGQVCDLRTVLDKDCALEILTFADEEGKHAFWHTAAHVMAQALSLIHISPSVSAPEASAPAGRACCVDQTKVKPRIRQLISAASPQGRREPRRRRSGAACRGAGWPEGARRVGCCCGRRTCRFWAWGAYRVSREERRGAARFAGARRTGRPGCSGACRRPAPEWYFPVSYTHLDVYKRQVHGPARGNRIRVK